MSSVRVSRQSNKPYSSKNVVRVNKIDEISKWNILRSGRLLNAHVLQTAWIAVKNDKQLLYIKICIISTLHRWKSKQKKKKCVRFHLNNVPICAAGSYRDSLYCACSRQRPVCITYTQITRTQLTQVHARRCHRPVNFFFIRYLNITYIILIVHHERS